MAMILGKCKTGVRHRGILGNPRLRDEIRELFPDLKICRECYDHKRYIEDKARRMATAPAVAYRQLANMMEDLDLSRESGFFSDLQVTNIGEFYENRYVAGVKEARNANPELQKQREVFEERRKQAQLTGGVPAESLEEGPQLIEAGPDQWINQREHEQWLSEQAQAVALDQAKKQEQSAALPQADTPDQEKPTEQAAKTAKTDPAPEVAEPVSKKEKGPFETGQKAA